MPSRNPPLSRPGPSVWDYSPPRAYFSADHPSNNFNQLFSTSPRNAPSPVPDSITQSAYRLPDMPDILNQDGGPENIIQSPQPRFGKIASSDQSSTIRLFGSSDPPLPPLDSHPLSPARSEQRSDPVDIEPSSNIFSDLTPWQGDKFSSPANKKDKNMRLQKHSFLVRNSGHQVTTHSWSVELKKGLYAEQLSLALRALKAEHPDCAHLKHQVINSVLRQFWQLMVAMELNGGPDIFKGKPNGGKVVTKSKPVHMGTTVMMWALKQLDKRIQFWMKGTLGEYEGAEDILWDAMADFMQLVTDYTNGMAQRAGIPAARDVFDTARAEEETYPPTEWDGNLARYHRSLATTTGGFGRKLILGHSPQSQRDHGQSIHEPESFKRKANRLDETQSPSKRPKR